MLRSLTQIALLGLVAGLTACSALDSGKINYKSTAKAPTLEVPPDLTQLSRDNRYTVPGSTVTATNYQQTAPLTVGAGSTATTTAGDVRIERSGTQRWLVVDRPADKVWDTVKAFWQENGFTLTLDDPRLGIMETEWAENRGKLPQDFIRRTLGKVLDNLFDSGERDKYRVRLERADDSRTEIYLSHRGLVEEYTDSSKTQTRWLPRPTDPELEAEFLRRLMLKLGASVEQSQAALGTLSVKPGVLVREDQGQPVLTLGDGFERAWRRVGLTLDRTGFTVEDRDRSQGTYFVRYVEPTAKTEEPGFFSRMFSGTSAAPSGPRKYRITVKGQDSGSRVTLLDANGDPEDADKARRILQVIADDLR